MNKLKDKLNQLDEVRKLKVMLKAIEYKLELIERLLEQRERKQNVQ